MEKLELYKVELSIGEGYNPVTKWLFEGIEDFRVNRDKILRAWRKLSKQTNDRVRIVVTPYSYDPTINIDIL